MQNTNPSASPPSHEDVIAAVRQVTAWIDGDTSIELDNISIASLRAALSQLEASRWRPIDDEAKQTDDNILLGCTWSTFRLVAFWDDTPERPGFPWQSPDGASYPEGRFDRWMPLPAPPVAASEGREGA